MPKPYGALAHCVHASHQPFQLKSAVTAPYQVRLLACLLQILNRRSAPFKWDWLLLSLPWADLSRPDDRSFLEM